VQKDAKWRTLKSENDALRQKRNSISQEINSAKKAGKSIEPLLAEAKSLPDRIKQNDVAITELELRNRWLLMRIPNLLADDVPYGKDSSENVPIKSKGKASKPSFEIVHHGELAKKLGLADFDAAVKVSGSGFFYLLGDLALLDLALQRFAIDLLLKKGFVLVQPPYLLNRSAYETMVSLSDFEEVMYKVDGADQYLIATSEHPLGARFIDHTFSPSGLPVRMAGISACFRREIGKHGLDERGFFRVHQFNKVEQVVFCLPQDSPKQFESIRRNSEEFLEALSIPYRTVLICTGDMGIIASKKYDIEGWSPREQKYFELMSCSNCTDYQAHRLNAKYADPKTNARESVHTLNNTMVATTRFLRCCLENWQTKDGTIKLPKALWKYMNGKKEIKAPVASKQKQTKKPSPKRSKRPATKAK
jgi:seryl-tRNA synthetase